MGNNIICIILARSDSSRLPKKHLKKVRGKPMIYYLINRMLNIPSIDKVVLATTSRQCDDTLSSVSKAYGAEVYRSDLEAEDVIGRFASVARDYKAKIAIKANGDNPLQSPEVIEKGIKQLISEDSDFLTGKNSFTGLPVGLGAEVLSRKSIEWLDINTPSAFREDTTNYIFQTKTSIKPKAIRIPPSWVYEEGSITVDNETDFKRLEEIISTLPKSSPSLWKIEAIIDTMKRRKVYE